MSVFSKKVYELVGQIPKGKVITYREIALFLGNVKCARAVGNILNKNADLKNIPCYKVVHSDGRIGGYKLGKEKKIELLKKDGIEIKNGKVVDFGKVLFNDFK